MLYIARHDFIAFSFSLLILLFIDGGSVMNNKLLNFARYLGSQGLYKEAATIEEIMAAAEREESTSPYPPLRHHALKQSHDDAEAAAKARPKLEDIVDAAGVKDPKFQAWKSEQWRNEDESARKNQSLYKGDDAAQEFLLAQDALEYINKRIKNFNSNHRIGNDAHPEGLARAVVGGGSYRGHHPQVLETEKRLRELEGVRTPMPKGDWESQLEADRILSSAKKEIEEIMNRAKEMMKKLNFDDGAAERAAEPWRTPPPYNPLSIIEPGGQPISLMDAKWDSAAGRYFPREQNGAYDRLSRVASEHAEPLRKIAKYLASQGFYKEAASLKKVAGENLSDDSESFLVEINSDVKVEDPGSNSNRD
jgi:hypothetical protein